MSESERNLEGPVDALFVDRWSPRSFSDEPLSEKEIRSIFEAARWAPSCANEQPWLFLYAVKDEDRARFLPILVEGNRRWAEKAPLVGFILAKRKFAKDDRPDRHHGFDAGAAWMSMTLQARLLGLYTHGMAGFHEEMVYDTLGVPKEEYEAMAAFVVGRKDAPEKLPEDLRKRESPSGRKPLSAVAVEGDFPGE